MLGFKRKRKRVDQLEKLRRHLEENPEDSESRLILANLYLKAGNQEAAIEEFHAAVRHLSTKGLDLEPIAIYKRVLSLDGIPMSMESLARMHEAEEFIARAKTAYEEIFRATFQKDTIEGASGISPVDNHVRDDKRDKQKSTGKDDSRPVPIETLLELSQAQPPIASAFQEGNSPEESSRLDPVSPVEGLSDQDDPDLPYDLGMSYYERGLIDEAIKDFTVACNQGTKTVESLSMLAKCYVKKGLYLNAASLIGEILKVDGLTRKQIDMLQGQLEEIKAKMNLATSLS